MIVRPMLGDWELPCVERVDLLESRRLARLGVPGLTGDLHQDLGTQSLTVAITGSLDGDQRRSDLLGSLQQAFLAGEPLPFVADIVESSELENVVIVSFEVVETREQHGDTQYRIVLRQYVEPPPPPAGLPELPEDMLGDLADLAGSLMDAMDLPGLLGGIPDLADPTAAIKPAMDSVKSAVGQVPAMLGDLGKALGVGA
jgi:hypothetical protein